MATVPPAIRLRRLVKHYGQRAALRGKAAFAAFAAAKAGLRMVSQSFAREFGPRGIHVAHAIIDGSIEGDKIFSVVGRLGGADPGGLPPGCARSGEAL